MKSVNQRLQEEWDETKCEQEKWDTLKTACVTGLRLSLDMRIRDNQIESEKNLKLLFLERNRLYALWLSTGNEIYKKNTELQGQQASSDNS